MNVVTGRVEAVLYSSLSASRYSRFLYRHLPYSSLHAEESQYKHLVESLNYRPDVFSLHA